MNNLNEFQNLITTQTQRIQNSARNNYLGSNIQYSPGPSHLGENQKQNCQPTKIKQNRRAHRRRNNSSKNEDKNITEKTKQEKYSMLLPSTSNGRNVNHSFIVSNEKMSNIDFHFCTKNINYSVGRYIRSRNTESKYIRLRSFFKKGMKKPYIFSTDFSVSNLAEDLKKLDLSLNQELKLTTEKFPKTKVTKRRKRERESAVKESDKIQFPDYISEFEVKNGLDNSSLIRGFVRINPKNVKDAYVSNEDTSVADYYLTSVRDRNKSLEGDEVILELKPETEWINGYKTAIVVYLLQKVFEKYFFFLC